MKQIPRQREEVKAQGVASFSSREVRKSAPTESAGVTIGENDPALENQ
jgi:hypothetical protein